MTSEKTLVRKGHSLAPEKWWLKDYFQENASTGNPKGKVEEDIRNLLVLVGVSRRITSWPTIYQPLRVFGGNYPPWNRHNSWKHAFPKRKVVSHFRLFFEGFFAVRFRELYILSYWWCKDSHQNRKKFPSFGIINGRRRLRGDAQRRTARDGGRTASLSLRDFCFVSMGKKCFLQLIKR